ncbi:MAG: hypothetical protein M1821_000943 [Bathelium mastoideum]|nr:MAG: hypothetical protein M1821_000943 [Bathelium mastoideum]
MRTLLSTVLAVTALLSAATARSLKSTVSSYPSLSILHSLLNQFDLLDLFDSLSNVTLIAPTDDAYRALAEWGFNVSEVEPFIARALLTYHVLDGAYTTDAIPYSDEPQVVHTLLQPPILTNVTKGAAVKLSRFGSTGLLVESGLQVIGGVEEADIHFDDGVIHTLNSSMVLPHNISTTAAIGNLFQFLDAMDAAEIVEPVESLKDVTLFIPHDGAFKKLNPLLRMLKPQQLAEVLGYHAVPGRVLYHESLLKHEKTLKTLQGEPILVSTDDSGTVFVNGAQVVRSDLITYGGVAHIINDVLIPDSNFSSEAQSSADPSFHRQKTPWTPVILW